MKLSIITVTYNHKYFPEMSLKAIAKANIKVPHEIIIVDNGTTDESIGFLREQGKKGTIKLIETGKNVGFGQGNNIGAKQAKGEYVLIMNPDIFPHEGSVDTMISYLEKHPEIGILGPKLVYYNGQIQESCRRFMSFTDLVIKRTFLQKIPFLKRRLDTYLMHDFDHTKTQAVDLLTGACMLLKKSVYDELGGFDKLYFLFMEDFDLCQRVWQKGCQVVYYPEAVMTHYHKRLSGGSLWHIIWKKPFWYHVISSVKYFWRWRGRRNFEFRISNFDSKSNE